MRRPFPLDPVDLARQAADDARGRIDATGDRLAAIAEDGEVLRLYPSDSSALASQGPSCR